jgi:putative ABC transport system permease protein
VTPSPPRLVARLLAFAFADPEWRDSVLGDLQEEFSSACARLGPSRARWWYRRQALGLTLHRLAAHLPGRSRMPQRLPEPAPDRAGMLGLLGYDLRQAWRSVRHHPALSLTVVIVLAVALAANATIFALADAMVFRPFRYPGVARAVMIASDGHAPIFARTSVAQGDFIEWREQTREVMDRLAAASWWDPNYTKDGPPQQIPGFRVSPAFFEILGAQAELGRTLVDSDERGAEQVAVLSDAFWKRQFGGSRDVLGRLVWLDGTPYRVVGVMAPDFRVPFGPDVWAPLSFPPEARSDRRNGGLMVFGRLAPGATIQDAENRMQILLAEQKRIYPEMATRQVSVRSFTEGLGDPVTPPFIAVFQAAALLLLLVACANVANLLLARNTERSRELAVRLALGAGRGRLMWQLVLEALVLSAIALVVSMPLAWAALLASRAALPQAALRFIPGIVYMSLEPRTFAVTLLIALVATLGAAVIPAWRAARGSVSETLRPGTRVSDSAGRQRGRAILATAQIALTLALLATAGLMLSALYRATGGPVGFDATSVLTGSVPLPEARYADPVKRRQLVETVLTQLRTSPAIVDAAVIQDLPYSGNYHLTRFWTEGVPPTEPNAVRVVPRPVTPNAFGVLRVPLVAGRALTSADDERAPLVAVVSQALVKKFWPNISPLGRRFRLASDGPLIAVVGVVGDVKQDWIPMFAPDQVVYLPFAQAPPMSFAFVIRTVGDPAQLGANLRAAVQAADPDQPVVELKTFQDVITDKVAGLRFVGNTLAVIAGVSALLSSVGLYSLMSFLTLRRTREIGVRVALGATSWDVIRMTGSTAARLTAIGVAIGLALSYGAGRALEQAAFGIVTGNLPLAIGLGAILAAISMAASYVPARRAAAIEPTEALRME